MFLFASYTLIFLLASLLFDYRTRHYTEIDPDHVPGTSSNDVGSETRERSKSTITYSSLDLDLLTDLEQVMDEKITNLVSRRKSICYPICRGFYFF